MKKKYTGKQLNILLFTDNYVDHWNYTIQSDGTFLRCLTYMSIKHLISNMTEEEFTQSFSLGNKIIAEVFCGKKRF
jgi:hypothetical protein